MKTLAIACLLTFTFFQSPQIEAGITYVPTVFADAPYAGDDSLEDHPDSPPGSAGDTTSNPDNENTEDYPDSPPSSAYDDGLGSIEDHPDSPPTSDPYIGAPNVKIIVPKTTIKGSSLNSITCLVPSNVKQANSFQLKWDDLHKIYTETCPANGCKAILYDKNTLDQHTLSCFL
ncbi:MAG: hypothetical protein H6623_02850 [Bdellovibrionaceae bacterium]|nr:hypothetical protein [Pseudobdellovibrionaceae bacterium]